MGGARAPGPVAAPCVGLLRHGERVGAPAPAHLALALVGEVEALHGIAQRTCRQRPQPCRLAEPPGEPLAHRTARFALPAGGVHEFGPDPPDAPAHLVELLGPCPGPGHQPILHLPAGLLRLRGHGPPVVRPHRAPFSLALSAPPTLRIRVGGLLGVFCIPDKYLVPIDGRQSRTEAEGNAVARSATRGRMRAEPGERVQAHRIDSTTPGLVENARREAQVHRRAENSVWQSRGDRRRQFGGRPAGFSR